jgi:hypothetical protein
VENVSLEIPSDVELVLIKDFPPLSPAINWNLWKKVKSSFKTMKLRYKVVK